MLSHSAVCFLGFSTEQSGRCNLFIGDWIPDPSGPVYTNETCKFIEDHQNCMKNGRPDNGYLYWTWKPRNCKLPRFNPYKFLQLMSNKTWALIGDSISRNHVQSFLCVLSKVTVTLTVNCSNLFALGLVVLFLCFHHDLTFTLIS